MSACLKNTIKTGNFIFNENILRVNFLLKYINNLALTKETPKVLNEKKN